MKLFGKNKKETEKNAKEAVQNDIEQVSPVRADRPSTSSLPKGGDVQSYRMVLSPHIAEKGTIMNELNKYIFKVNENANKTEIKKAIASLYGVEVVGVNVLHMPSKHRRVGKYEGKKSGFKKAIVTLKEGSKIDIAA